MAGPQNLTAQSVSELLDASLRMYRVKFVPFTGIVALIMVPEGILEFILIFLMAPEAFQQAQTYLTNFFSTFATLALAVGISNYYLGREFSIKSSYVVGLKRFWSVIWANFLKGLAAGSLVIVAFVCLLSTVQALAYVLFVFAVPIILFLSTRWSLSTQAIVLEDMGGSEGLSRSWALTKGYFWRVFGTSVLAGLLSLLITLVPSTMISYILGAMNISFRIIQVVELVVGQLGLILTLPFSIAVQVVIYYDLRIRKEGFDLLMLADVVQPAG